MSSITNVVTTIFRASGNQAIATMGSVASGFGTIGRNLNETSRMSERLNNQWRALGTTFRYALAGSAVFGTVQMVRNLGDLQRQIGLIQALGQAQNGILPNTKLPVTTLLSDARREAVRSITPLQQFNEGLINMFSTVQNVPENQAAKMMGDISLAAQMAQTDSETASKAIFGMFSTFNMAPNTANVSKMTRSITELITQVPGGPEAAKQIFQQFPQLASIAKMGRGTLPQIISLYMSNLRTGGTAGTTGRGLQYLMQTIAFPERQTKASRSALASVGITPDYVEKYGMTRALLRLITAIRARGGVKTTGATKTITDDALEQMAGDLPTSVLQLGDAGISGAGARLLAQAIPRIHGARALALLASRPEVLMADLIDINSAWEGHAAAVEKYKQEIQNFTNPQSLNKAAVAIQGIQQQLMLAYQPFVNLAAKGILKTQQETNAHPRAFRDAVLGGTGLAGALMIGKFFGFPGMSKIPGFRSLAKAGGAGYIKEEALRAEAGAGGQRSGQRPSDALFVIVVGEIFNSGGGGGGAIKEGEDVVKGALGLRAVQKVRGWFKKAPNLGEMLSTEGESVAAKVGTRAAAMTALKFAAKKAPFIGLGLSFFSDVPGAGSDSPEGEQGWAWRQRRAQEIFNKRLPAGMRVDDVYGKTRLGTFQGHAEVYMTLDITDKNTGLQKRVPVHVSVPMWEHGRAPSSKGKAGTQRK